MTAFFVAYPGDPPAVSDAISTAKRLVELYAGAHSVTTWQRPDLGGNDVISPIIEAIKTADVIAADVTVPNFNVTYELGYGIGLGKRVLPLVNRSFSNPLAEAARAGLYDTLLYESYANSEDLKAIFESAAPGKRLATEFPYDPQQLYIVLPTEKTNDITKLIGRAKRTGLRARTFDPAEEARLAATEAIRAVASSYGIVLPLLEPTQREATAHNLRVAFVAGVAHALEKPTLILQRGTWATPLDIRDEVQHIGGDDHLKEIFQDFAEEVRDSMFSSSRPKGGPGNKLASLNMGDPAAENEEVLLDNYFLERDEFRRVLKGEANIVVGRKGSGNPLIWGRLGKS